MISYQTYLFAHVLGIFLLFLGLGGRIVAALIGRASGSLDGVAPETRGARRLVMATHGVGLFLVLLGGFGLMARIGVPHGLGAWPGWLWVKVGVWGALGLAVTLPRRFPASARALWFAVPALGAMAAYMAVFKPF